MHPFLIMVDPACSYFNKSYVNGSGKISPLIS